MAVEARYHNLSPPQMLYNRDMMLNGLEDINNVYSTNMMLGGLSPVTGTTATAAEMVSPMYGTTMMKAESGLTYAHLPNVSRKRSREESNNSINMNQLCSYQTNYQNPNICGGNNRSSSGQFTFLGEDFSSQIQQQQLEVDNFIAHHTEKVRLEIEERRKRYSRRIMAAVEQGIMKKLKAKEDEIQKIVKFNWALEERVKSLCVENQIWRDLAQTNEATANVLRTNLEQVLAHAQNNLRNDVEAQLIDDAQSCCGSSNDNEVHNLIDTTNCHKNNGGEIYIEGRNRLCRNCGKDEACVLLLPCRHLCLCSVCGSSQNVCPVCKSTKTCSLHVNLDS
ncbi:hypothetical protein LIER_33188 [Lithospermum erythrorhizon]|uniref:RING-type domain-containing protein n=1 Tax=Lithospermum erythrorhizon TaxID=34254 RepID=A0AAV3RZD9_LITER